MRALLSVVLATLVVLAILPLTVIAMEPVDDDAVEVVESGDVIEDDDPSSSSLDDDVLHEHPLVCAPCETISWSAEPWHPHPEGRTPSRSTRPPRDA